VLLSREAYGAFKKVKEKRKEAIDYKYTNEGIYLAIQDTLEHTNISVRKMCNIAGIAISSYYNWKNNADRISDREKFNLELAEKIKVTYEKHKKILGYRRVKIFLKRDFDTDVNQKRVRRIMCKLNIQSVIRRKRYRYTPCSPQHTAENILHREFETNLVNTKWLTDVTEFKYGNGQKAYLSAIYDLGDRSIVAWELNKTNNNELVFKTFKKAKAKYPDARPIFHSDRGFQYTHRDFKKMLDKAGMIQSMSRVGRCIDNGPMEGFWGIIKSEMYYLKKHYETYEQLKKDIAEYITYYNTKRYQKNLGNLTPLEYRKSLEESTISS